MAESDRQPLDPVHGAFQDFTRSTVAGGILLMVAAAIGLIWANSPFRDSYASLWETHLRVGAGDLTLDKPLHLWINDGLMAIFFLVVGLEIKREFLVGELATARTALLPIAAALGGAIVPAVLYLSVAGGSGEAARGWGVPMATDIAFALGVLALLGSRVPAGLRVFLVALAIVDDLLAVLVITVFYTDEVSFEALIVGAAVLGALVLANRLHVRHPLVYAALGIALWLAVLQSGVHATVAGVLLALVIPARIRVDATQFVKQARAALDELNDATGPGQMDHEDYDALWDLQDLTNAAQSPMSRMEHTLHPWSALVIVPIFALANSGVAFGSDLASVLVEPALVGVVVGLVLGKPIGISLAALLVIRTGLTSLPDGVSARQILGAAWLGGIGFTMSLFIADLAFGGSPTLAYAKIGVLIASAIAGLGGFLLLRSARSA